MVGTRTYHLGSMTTPGAGGFGHQARHVRFLPDINIPIHASLVGGHNVSQVENLPEIAPIIHNESRISRV